MCKGLRVCSLGRFLSKETAQGGLDRGQRAVKVKFSFISPLGKTTIFSTLSLSSPVSVLPAVVSPVAVIPCQPVKGLLCPARCWAVIRSRAVFPGDHLCLRYASITSTSSTGVHLKETRISLAIRGSRRLFLRSSSPAIPFSRRN